MNGGKPGGMWLALLVAPILLLLWGFFVLLAIPHAGVHLCKWPATISCDRGVPVVWWLLDGALTLVVIGGLVDALPAFRAHTTGDRRWRVGLYGLWGVNLATLFLAAAPDRELAAGELVVGTLTIVAGLMLVAWTVASLRTVRGARRRTVAVWVLAAVVAVATSITVALSPGRFQHVYDQRAAHGSPLAPTEPVPTPPDITMNR